MHRRARGCAHPGGSPLGEGCQPSIPPALWDAEGIGVVKAAGKRRFAATEVGFAQEGSAGEGAARCCCEDKRRWMGKRAAQSSTHGAAPVQPGCATHLWGAQGCCTDLALLLGASSAVRRQSPGVPKPWLGRMTGVQDQSPPRRACPLAVGRCRGQSWHSEPPCLLRPRGTWLTPV